MRRIHYADVANAACAVLCVASEDRMALCLRLIREAQTAEAHRRDIGHPHPLWGNGSLMDAARCRERAPERGFDDPRYRAAFALVLQCLQQAYEG